MTLQDIYKNAKKINPMYNGTFADFVKDFIVPTINDAVGNNFS